jgi:hypothetical protein
VAGLALVPLASCASFSSVGDPGGGTSGATGRPSSSSGGSIPSEVLQEEDMQSNVVMCSGTCSLTLSGVGAGGQVLGTAVELRGIGDGRATLRVGERDVACGPGDRISSGSLVLDCTSVTQRAVTLTASAR